MHSGRAAGKGIFAITGRRKEPALDAEGQVWQINDMEQESQQDTTEAVCRTEQGTKFEAAQPPGITTVAAIEVEMPQPTAEEPKRDLQLQLHLRGCSSTEWHEEHRED